MYFTLIWVKCCTLKITTVESCQNKKIFNFSWEIKILTNLAVPIKKNKSDFNQFLNVFDSELDVTKGFGIKNSICPILLTQQSKKTYFNCNRLIKILSVLFVTVKETSWRF